MPLAELSPSAIVMFGAVAALLGVGFFALRAAFKSSDARGRQRRDERIGRG